MHLRTFVSRYARASWDQGRRRMPAGLVTAVMAFALIASSLASPVNADSPAPLPQPRSASLGVASSPNQERAVPAPLPGGRSNVGGAAATPPSPLPSSRSQPPSAGSNPSGQPIPVGDLPGWHQIFTEDFTASAPIGTFEATYGAKWDGYHDGTGDSSQAGQYFPSRVLSAHDGVLDMYIHTENGVPMVAAPVPIIPNPGGSWHGQYYGRYTIRFRADPIAGYKTAWLLWPDSGVWPRDGEIDYPEGDLNGTFSAYMHHLGAMWGGDQDYFERLGTYPSWHTATTEWRPDSVTFYLDGRVVGRSTARIPNTPMHWVLQTETSPNGAHPATTDAGHVLIDWVAIYAYDP